MKKFIWKIEMTGQQTGRKRTNWPVGVSVSIVAVLAFAQPVIMPASAAPSTTAAATSSAVTPKVQQFMRDADSALKTGNLNLAVIELKNAVQLAPNAGEPRARLGLALLQQGQAVAAERELRQAKQDFAPEELVTPGILQAMIMRGETKQLLTEFPDPPSDAKGSLTAEVLKSRGIASVVLGDLTSARAAMDRSLRLNRDSSILLARAKLAGLQNDPVLARQLLEEALKAAPNDEEAMGLYVSLLRQRGEAQKALVIADEFVKRNPVSIAGRVARIEVLLSQNDEKQAKNDVDAIIRQTPTSQFGLYYRAVLAERAKDFAAAWRNAQRLAPVFIAAQPAVAMEVARIAMSSGNPETGAGVLAGLIARHPEILPARIELAAEQVREKHPEAALKTLDPVKISDDPQIQATLAQAYLQLRRYGDASASLQKALNAPSARNSEGLKRQLAFSELATGDLEKGIEELRQLAARNPASEVATGQLIMALIRDSRFDEALTAVDRFTAARPRTPLAGFYRGLIFANEGKFEEASRQLTQSLELDPKFLPARLYRSDLLAARGEPDAASKDLQQALAQDPNDIAAAIGLAQIAVDTGHDNEAVSALTKAINIAPKNPLPRVALANYQILKAKYQDAQRTADELLKVIPNNPDGLVLRARIQSLTDARTDAVATLRTFVALYPQLPVAQIMLANALFATKDSAGAEAAAKKAIEFDPANAGFRAILIAFQTTENKPDAALATAHEYASAHPGTDADLLIGQTLIRLNRIGEAYTTLAKAYAAKPNAAVAEAAALTASTIGDSKSALSILADWTHRNPKDYVRRRDYASLLLQTGDRPAAQKQFELLLKERPEDPIVLDGLSWILQKDDLVRALSLASLAAKIAPRSPEVMDTLGWIKLQRHDSMGALTLLKRAHDLKSDDPEIGYHLAVAMDATGKRADARALLKSVLAKNSKFDEVQTARQLLAHW